MYELGTLSIVYSPLAFFPTPLPFIFIIKSVTNGTGNKIWRENRDLCQLYFIYMVTRDLSDDGSGAIRPSNWCLDIALFIASSFGKYNIFVLSFVPAYLLSVPSYSLTYFDPYCVGVELQSICLRNARSLTIVSGLGNLHFDLFICLTAFLLFKYHILATI